jgi:uncharacterized protein YyaL (SSP411 family)
MNKVTVIASLVILAAVAACGASKKKDNTAISANPLENSSNADSLSKFQWNDFSTGYALAKNTGKLLLVDVYTDWCGWCKVMDKKTYTDPAVISTLASQYICVKLNPEQSVTYTMDEETLTALDVKNFLSDNRQDGYPTTYFMKPSTGKKVIAVVGYQEATAFHSIISKTIPSKF